LSEPEVAELLGLLAPKMRPTMFDIQGGGPEWTRAIFEEVRPGRTVGFLTRGHPQVCGGLAFNLIRECRRRGVAWRVLDAVSSMDVLALSGVEALAGTQVFDYA